MQYTTYLTGNSHSRYSGWKGLEGDPRVLNQVILERCLIAIRYLHNLKMMKHR